MGIDHVSVIPKGGTVPAPHDELQSRFNRNQMVSAVRAADNEAQ
jgi:hypothetical protein